MAMWILAAVLALVCLLLLSPIRLRFTLLDGKAQLQVRLLFFRLRFPNEKGKKKKGKPKGAKKSAVQKAPAKKQKKKESGLFSGPWNGERLRAAAVLLWELLVSCGRSGAFLLKKVRLKRLWAEVMVVRQNAHLTAEESGKLNAWCYSALSLLRNFIQPEDLYLNIYPGFWATQETAAADVIVSVTPARLLGAGCLLAYGALQSLFRFSRPAKKRAGRSPAAGPEGAAAGSHIGKEGI